MVDRLEQKERYDRELNVVKRARFNQTIKPYQTNEVPEPKIGVEPHTVKELPALPVRERRQDNMLQLNQDNMLEDGEVVSFGQRAQQQDQQQLQLRQHNIPRDHVYPKHFKTPNPESLGFHSRVASSRRISLPVGLLGGCELRSRHADPGLRAPDQLKTANATHCHIFQRRQTQV